jgi:hypothetical protein
MWIEMLETFAGPTGPYLKGSKYDPPESTLKQIKAKGKHLWRKTIAPWEDSSIVPDMRKPEQPAVQPAEQPPIPDEVTQ